MKNYVIKWYLLAACDKKVVRQFGFIYNDLYPTNTMQVFCVRLSYYW